MHITLEADYAVRIVICLAEASDRMDASSISESTGVTLRFALKILRKLVYQGIVKSFKGTQGGYEMAKDPGEVTLREVIETIEGTYYFSRCLNPENSCERKRTRNCSVSLIYAQISQDVRNKLEAVTFDQLCL
jgi:Rrf2 family protein